MQEYSKYLRGGEEVWYVHHRHPAPQLWRWALGGLLVAAGFFFLWPLFKLGGWGVVVFLVDILVGTLVVVRTSVMWRNTVLIITNQRLIDVHRGGLWHEAVSQLSYTDLDDVGWSRAGVWGTILGFGTVEVHGVNGTVRLLFSHVTKPSQLAGVITTIREQNQARRTAVVGEA